MLKKEIDLVLIELHATKPMSFYDLPSVRVLRVLKTDICGKLTYFF